MQLDDDVETTESPMSLGTRAERAHGRSRSPQDLCPHGPRARRCTHSRDNPARSGISSRFEEPLGRELAMDFPVFIPDQPGFGHSEGPDEALDVNGLADFIADFMDACELPRAVLVGASFGCQLAVAFAVRHRERVEKLVLQGPASAPEERGALRMSARWLLNGRREPFNWLLLPEYRAAGFRRVLKSFQHYRRYAIEDHFPQVLAPTLVVRGERDPLVTQSWAERIVEMLPHGRMAVIPGAAHTLSRFWPRELAEEIRPFLLDEQFPPYRILSS